MQGKRGDFNPECPDRFPYPELQAGEYGRDDKGNWWAIPPGHPELLANLARHTVKVLGDGKITVTPSILVRNGVDSWHGYITDGQWSNC